MPRVLALCLIYFIPVFPLFASYSNPMLKVLLFKSKQQIQIKSSRPMTVESRQLDRTRAKRLSAQSGRKGGVVIDHHRLSHTPVKLRGSAQIWIKRGKSKWRRYKGSIELRPIRGLVYVINHILTEDYIQGVLNGEMSTDWHIEAVKAQSVLARTYALRKYEARKYKAWHIGASQFDQVYLGASAADQRARYAVENTQGQVIKYQGGLAEAFYHSNCGGTTEDPYFVWNADLPYLQVRSVPYGEDDPRFYWQTQISDWEMNKILKKITRVNDHIHDIYVEGKTSSGRAHQLVLIGSQTDHPVLARDFRKYAGYRRIQSLLFRVIKVPGGFYFEGQGNGHGVGLCQWAAKEMAEVGYKYRDILHYFYNPIVIGNYQG